MKDFSIEKYFEQIKSELKFDSKTGIGYCGISATSRLASVDESALRKHFRSSDLNPSFLAKMLTQSGFDPRTQKDFARTGIPDIAVGLIVKYYAWMAGSNCNDHAKAMDMAFSAIAIRVLIKATVGKEEEKYQSIEDFVRAQLPEIAAKWECSFEKEFWAALESTYGLEQKKRACACFINCYIYGWFPSSLRERLDSINPIKENGYRENRQHQHFDDVLLKMLQKHIRVVTVLLIKAKSKADFKARMQAVPKFTFDSSIQQPSGAADNA